MGQKFFGDTDTRIAHGNTHALFVGRHRNDHLAFWREFDRIAHQVGKHPLHSARVAKDPQRLRRQLHPKVQSFLAGQWLQQLIDVLHRLGHLDRYAPHHHRAGAQPGQIQDVVDRGQQSMSAFLDVLQKLFVQRIVGLLLDHRSKAENGRKRRAQLVRRRGKNRLFGGIGFTQQAGEHVDARAHGFDAVASIVAMYIWTARCWAT